MMEKWARTRVDDSTPAGRAVLTHEAVWLLDPAEKVRAFPALAPSATGYAALAALPLMASGTVLGVLGVSFAVAARSTPSSVSICSSWPTRWARRCIGCGPRRWRVPSSITTC